MKKICSLIVLSFLTISLFAKHISREGTYAGIHWQFIYDGDLDLVVDGQTVLHHYYALDTLIIDKKIYIKATKTKSDGLEELVTIKGDRAIPNKFDLISRVMFNDIDYYEVAVKKGDGYDYKLYDSQLKLFKSGYEFIETTTLEGREGRFYRVCSKEGGKYVNELYSIDWHLVLPKYHSLSPRKDEMGNLKYWYIEDSNGYIGWLDQNWNWIISLDKRYSKINDITIAGAKYYICKKGGYWGLFDTKFNEVIAPDFEDLGVFDGTNFIKFKLNGFWGVMTLQGRVTRTIIPTTRGYTNISRYVKSQKRFMYEMNGYKGECNHLGQQVSKIKVDTPVATPTPTTPKKEVTKVEETPKKQEGGGTQTIIVEHHRDPVPVQQWQACWACGGMGTMGCDNCGGSGTKYIGDRLHRCSRCNGQGLIPCNICFGNKGQYITVYQ